MKQHSRKLVLTSIKSTLEYSTEAENLTKAVKHTSRATATIKEAHSLKDHYNYKGILVFTTYHHQKRGERVKSSSNLALERKYDERI